MGDQAAFRQGLKKARRRGALAVTVCLSLLMGAACSQEVPEGRPVAACSLPPEGEIPAGIPDDFPWPEDVMVTDAQPAKKFVAITGFGEQSVEELSELM